MTDRRFWPILFVAYFAMQALVRILIGPALELDEAEAFWFARHLALGYNAQPPLYFWLQWGMFQVFGEGILALALLKAALLSTTLIVLYRLFLIAVPPFVAGIAAASLSLLPQVVWEAQRALTHSVLVLTMAVILFAVMWTVLEMGRWRDHLALGLVIGLGLLSKYNFVLLPLGLLATAMVLPDLRRHLRPGRLLVSLGLALLVVAPFMLWSMQNAGVAGGSLHKLGLAATGPVMARLYGAAAFVTGLLAFLALAIAVLSPLALFRDRARRVIWPPVLRFLGVGAAMSLAILLVGLLIAGGTEVKDRWLLPLAWPFVPVATAVLWPVLGRLQQRVLAGTVLGLWAVAAVLLPYATLRDPGYRAADFGALMDQVQAVAPGTTIVGSDVIWVLGNLAYHDPTLVLIRSGEFPDAPFVLVAEPGTVDLGLRKGVTVPYVIWHGNRSLPVEISAITAP